MKIKHLSAGRESKGKKRQKESLRKTVLVRMTKTVNIHSKAQE